MTQHTPGPWVQGNEDDFRGIPIERSDVPLGAYVAIANVPVDYSDRPEREANARLIAAAPELLEFVRKRACGLPACINGCARAERQRDLACEAHAAIAKAEGRT